MHIFSGSLECFMRRKRTSAVQALAVSSQATYAAAQLAQVLESAGHLVRMLSNAESAKSDKTGTQFGSYCRDVVKYLPLNGIWTESNMDWGNEHYAERGYCLWGGELHGGLEKGAEALWLLESGSLLAIRISDSTSRYTSTTQRPVAALTLALQTQEAIRVVRRTASALYDTYRHLVRKNDPERKRITSLLFGSTPPSDPSIESTASLERTITKEQRREQSLLRRQSERARVENYQQRVAEAERKRDSEREAQQEGLRFERKSLGLCVACGGKLGVFDKVFRRPQHKSCF